MGVRSQRKRNKIVVIEVRRSALVNGRTYAGAVRLCHKETNRQSALLKKPLPPLRTRAAVARDSERKRIARMKRQLKAQRLKRAKLKKQKLKQKKKLQRARKLRKLKGKAKAAALKIKRRKRVSKRRATISKRK